LALANGCILAFVQGERVVGKNDCKKCSLPMILGVGMF